MNVILTTETVHRFVLMLKVVIFVPVMMDIHYILMEGVVLVYILAILCMSGGFKLSDINECASNNTNKCNQICSNTEGSYICYCNSGYELSLDHATCVGMLI